MSGWHMKKEVPIALIAAIVLQTGSFVWFMAKLDSRIDALEAGSMAQTGYDRRQWDELNVTKQIVTNNDKRITAVEAQQGHIRRQVDKLVDRLIENSR